MAERQAHSGSLFVPLMAGLAGAGIALLFAPRSGQETRQQLRGRAEDLQQQAKETVDQARSRVESGVEEAKDMKQRLHQAIRKTDQKTAETDMDVSPAVTNWDKEI